MRVPRWMHPGLKGAFFLVLVSAAFGAQAVPSFARQTGFPCQQCHTVAPELTPFGRLFKLNGFVLTTLPKVEAPSGDSSIPLELNRMPGMAAEVDVADSFTQKAQPGSVENGTIQFPSKFKVFFAGGVSDHIGVFNYFEYTQQDDHIGLDLTDVRITDNGKWGDADVVYGLTINNAPTVEDPWNTLNVWGLPHVGSEVAPSPGAAPLLGSILGDVGTVAGAGGYAMFDNAWYADLTLYRAAVTGAAQPVAKAAAVDGTFPYWRVAWTHPFGSDDFEVGASGVLDVKFNQGLSGTGAAGMSDKYTDFSLDSQYVHPLDSDLLTIHARYIHESQTLDSSAAAGLSAGSDSLKTFRADATYLLRRGSGHAFTLGYFNTTGSTDALLYVPGAVSGYALGSPDSNGWLLQYTYLPYENTQFTVQYIAYSKFNGASSNYDGSGRSASDNDTLFLLMMVDW